MAGPYSPQNITDLHIATRENAVGKGAWADVSITKQNHFFNRFLDKGKLIEDFGTKLTFRLQVAYAQTARTTGLFDQANVAIRRNTLVSGEVPWSKHDVSYSYDQDEPMFNGTDWQKIVDVTELLVHGAYNDWFEFAEDLLFTMPASASEVPQGFLGLPYWLVVDATELTPAFAGGNPSGHTAGAAGIDADTHTGWKNLTWGHNGMDFEFIDSVRDAMWQGNFESPKPYKAAQTGRTGTFNATTKGNVQGLIKLLRSSNENYGDDAMGKNRNMTVPVNGQKVEACAKLTEESATNDEIWYSVNMAHLGIKGIGGKTMEWFDPILRPGTTDVYDVFMKTWMQMFCDNRREAGFVTKHR